MRIALPIWEDKISPVLDTALRLLVVDLESRREIGRFEIYMDEIDISRRSSRIKALAINVLICGAISRPFIQMLTAAGIHVIAGIAGQAREILTAYGEDRLSDPRYRMPGCRDDADKRIQQTMERHPNG